ncbi:glycosyltransferase family 1 protein [Amylocarpus encephaloides]|uniref:Glycosyltransferase family 1 protein n=1 Tax=Amylocarpus encephaloides TaxID=45428 RepID=A0A9P7YAK7_9HELO|nr:glycosyltransferase family 1 protein [Amylocarpus encephaloides]
MATTSENASGQGGNSLPATLIAQAEAAIVGNFDERPSLSRHASRASQYPNDSRGFRPSAQSTRESYLALPRDSATEAPPAYGENPDEIEMNQDGLDTKAKVTDDGRININIHQKSRRLSELLAPALRNHLDLVAQENETPLPPGYVPESLGGAPGQTPPPRLNVVIHVVGSRGDVQPFVALGKTLKATYGHRVRLATHPTFQGFVEENGLEFFSIGGDPAELMAFMVKNPGLMPGIDSLKSGDVGKRRRGMEELVLGCWRSCIEAGNGLGAPPLPPKGSTESLGFEAGINMDTDPADRPFIADAIIANPPSFAHVHIAEKMGIPLHMMFTMPWSPTQSFQHPLANIESSNTDVNMTNFVSYALVEMMTWQGLGDVINRFRERALGLEPISLIWAPGMLSRLRVPYTYCWSPALIPKPKDWGQHISISGFYFLSLASSYTPAPDLAAFLAAGPPPVYIGFGSIVVDDPNAMTKMIFEAVEKTGCRALVSKGWGGLGGDEMGLPEGIFMLGNVPHDWLFQRVSTVVHHGGAGTTAAGIATGKPTVVVPFFGDQPFWGAMVARAGAGPPPIPFKELTADKLSEALLEALKPETLAKAKELGARIKEEKGTDTGAKSFHDMLNIDTLRCSLAPNRVAVWRLKRTQTRLSALAANVLASEGLLSFADLKLYRSKEYETDEGPWDPITGGASALLGTIASLSMGVADFPIEIFKKTKTTHEAIKTAVKEKNSSTDDKSPATSRHPLEVELDKGETPSSQLNDPISTIASRASTIATSSKVSYESPGRSSTDPGSMDTPRTSIGTKSSIRGSSMKEAMKGTMQRARSLSRDRGSNKDGKSRSGAESPFRHVRRESNKVFDPSNMTLENAGRASKGVTRIVAAGLKSPMDFTLGIARGFHNAPKLYGDDTVRPQEKVTDFQSGLKAAGKEFGFGFYDGITGLVTQPLRGAEKAGAAGLIKGIGKGIGGLILKPGAAIWGLPGYAFMGVHREIRNLFGSSVLNYIIAARTAQGFEDAQACTPEERASVINNWKAHKDEYQSSKMKIIEQGGPEVSESGYLSPKGFLQARHLSFDERKKLHKERQGRRREAQSKPSDGEKERRYCPFCRRSNPHRHTPRATQDSPVVAHAHPEGDEHEEFEHAIHASVAATSKGNVEEDEMIERAIRASVRELQNADGATLTDQEALDRAIQASVEEGRRQSESSAREYTERDAEAESLLEHAIQQSLLQYSAARNSGPEVDSDDDEAIKLAIVKSKEDVSLIPKPDDIDEALNNAIQASKEEALREKAEEDIMLERVRKQSLWEAEREAATKKVTDAEAMTPTAESSQPPNTAVDEHYSKADEEALQEAIKLSLQSPTTSGLDHAYALDKWSGNT